MKNQIITYIKTNLATEPIEEIDLHEDLLGSGLVDSIGMAQMVVFIEGEANIKVYPEEMILENFMTVDHILKYIESKQNTDS